MPRFRFHILPSLLLTGALSAWASPTLAQSAERRVDSLETAADTTQADAKNGGFTEDKAALPMTKRWGIGGNAGAAYLIPMDDECRAIMHNYGTYLFDLHADVKTTATERNPYDAAFGYPTWRAGILLADYSHIRLWRSTPRLDYVSRMGVVAAVYGGFLRDLYRSPKWRVGYKFENGLGIASRPYRRSGNADNEVIGSRWNVFLNIGFYAKFLISPQFEAALGLDYLHFSNSALDRPNKGANNAGLTAGLTYYPEPQQPNRRVTRSHEAYKERRFYVEASAGWVGKTLQDDWVFHYWIDAQDAPKYRTSHFTIHHAVTALVAPMYRYSRRYASGIGLDYTYAAYASRLSRLDKARGATGYTYSRHVLGVTLRHEVFYRHLSLAMGLGVYIHRKMGYTADVDEKPYYETIGLRYNIPRTGDRLFLGYNVKAHFTKADCMQVSVGWRFGRGEGKVVHTGK